MRVVPTSVLQVLQVGCKVEGMSNRSYPYIQGEEKIASGVCGVCKETKPIKRLEWRVDWFQGNCEFEDICSSCLNKRNQKEEARREAYYKKMEPVWERQRQKREDREDNLKSLVWQLGINIQEYDNGQWSFGNVLDWWTTTGTAIERKSRKRHDLSFKKPEQIIKVLKAII